MLLNLQSDLNSYLKWASKIFYTLAKTIFYLNFTLTYCTYSSMALQPLDGLDRKQKFCQSSLSLAKFRLLDSNLPCCSVAPLLSLSTRVRRVQNALWTGANSSILTTYPRQRRRWISMCLTMFMPLQRSYNS